MNSTRFIFFTGLIGLVVIVALVWLAQGGNTAAAFTLGILVGLTLILIGFGLYALTGHLHTKREQANFEANTRENLAMITAMQRVQNQQNSVLLNQVKALSSGQPSALPIPDDALIFDETIFTDLDDDPTNNLEERE